MSRVHQEFIIWQNDYKTLSTRVILTTDSINRHNRASCKLVHGESH